MAKKHETPVTEAEKTKEEIAAEKKAAAEAAKEAKKAEREAKKKADAEAKAANKVESVKQHGVTRPNRGVTLKVWEIADAISKAEKRPATRKEVTEKGEAEGLEVGTIHTQYGRWRKFNGLSSVRNAPSDEK